MPNVALDGTTIKHNGDEDGQLIATAVKTNAEKKPIGRVGDKCSIHSSGVVSPNDSTAWVEGLQVARVGDVTTCSPQGTLDAEGSAVTVFADDQGAGS